MPKIKLCVLSLELSSYIGHQRISLKTMVILTFYKMTGRNCLLLSISRKT